MSVVAYYRLGDQINSFSVQDSSGAASPNTGSLIAGLAGPPAYGAPGAFIFDANGSLDLTNSSNAPNGGFCTIDNSTQPPTVHNPLSGASSQWVFEAWVRWTAGTSNAPSASASVANNVLLDFTSASVQHEIQIGSAGGFIANPASQYGAALIFCGEGDAAVYPIISDILDGLWHYVVADFVPSGSTVTFYVDNTPLALVAGTVPSSFSEPINLTVGCPPVGEVGIDPDGGNLFAIGWAGLMDEVVFYNASLTSTQMTNHYQTGTWFQTVEIGAANGAASVGRLNKVLSVVGFPTSALVVPYPFLTELYAETNAITTTSGLNYIQTQSESEPGVIFQGGDGNIYGFNREYQYLNPTSLVSQGVIADSASVANHYNGPALQIVQDDLDIFNDIQVQSGRSANVATQTTAGVLQEWGSAQSPAAASSASVYGARTLQGLTSLQFQYDLDALATAQNYGAWYNFPIDRVQQVTLNSWSSGGNNIPIMLGVQLYTRYTIGYTGQTSGTPFSEDSLVESISHSVDMSGPSWSTSLAMSPYEILMTPFLLDISTMDGPDVLVL